MNGVCKAHFFLAPPPWGPGDKRSKSSNIIKTQLQSQYFLSHMKNIKHIRRDIWRPESCPRGRTPWGVVKFFFSEIQPIWCVSFLHERHMHWRHFCGPHPLGPWGGAKRSNIIKSELKGQFQRFLNQTLCIFSQMKDIKHIFFIIAPGWDLGVP